ncbi:Acyl-CoA desaturase 3 [Araneus ventricosus]|uniref:Acyl-CoA desaturase 3 n=1 Tax=Araneus ventricosus TaxID=182803 RepID=A0A4Y2LTR3_ARAVE|nr:Acyl-CoA desaturase 3 [Araneus ventricosus]
MLASIDEFCFYRFYTPLVLFFCFYLPIMIPVSCWGKTAWNSFFIAAMARYGVSMNSTFLVNSAAHKYSYQPFDKCIEARENSVVALLTIGTTTITFFPGTTPPVNWGTL